MTESEVPRGHTLPEIVIVITIAGLLMAIAAPRIQLGLDRVAVDAAASDVQATLGLARSLALAGHAPVAVDVQPDGALRVLRKSEVLVLRPVAAIHGVRLEATRDSLTYDPRGLGLGAANLSIRVRRGAAVETVFVSRLGRVR